VAMGPGSRSLRSFAGMTPLQHLRAPMTSAFGIAISPPPGTSGLLALGIE
jgi:hypothetical protein